MASASHLVPAGEAILPLRMNASFERTWLTKRKTAGPMAPPISEKLIFRSV
jgi:hypothetical protein